MLNERKRMMKVNNEALEKAKQLIDEGKFRINTPWRDAQPSEKAENRYIDQHGLKEYSAWYLALDPAAGEDSKDHYKFPFGDFNAVHRTGLVAAKQRAAQNHEEGVVAAADELLDLFDRLNAC
jgi:creatinine amidohydrolase/Fe(II)-dependent formamide hydrolase-like protein